MITAIETTVTEYETYYPELTIESLWRSSDKYGRSVWQNYAIDGVVCALPRRTAHLRPAGENYLVNLRDRYLDEATGKWVDSTVVYFAKAKDAKAFLLANGRRRPSRRVISQEVTVS